LKPIRAVEKDIRLLKGDFVSLFRKVLSLLSSWARSELKEQAADQNDPVAEV
jgi:hypothetical protein